MISNFETCNFNNRRRRGGIPFVAVGLMRLENVCSVAHRFNVLGSPGTLRLFLR